MKALLHTHCNSTDSAQHRREFFARLFVNENVLAQLPVRDLTQDVVPLLLAELLSDGKPNGESSDLQRCFRELYYTLQVVIHFTIASLKRSGCQPDDNAQIGQWLELASRLDRLSTDDARRSVLRLMVSRHS